MTIVLGVSAAVVAVVAAARSTWSPCGVSMLATITPLAETGRGHRYRSTALWFVAGSVAGGVTLGLALALLALGVGAAGLSSSTVALLACAASVGAGASDARVGGFALPAHHRQVNERWLDQFRPWVYGAGFGWQIGTGFATYIKTAAVYLLTVLAVLTGSWWAAAVLGALFGLVRGLAVFLGRSIASPSSLAAFHRRFTRLEPLVLAGVVATEFVSAVLFAFVASPWAGAVMALAGVGVVVSRLVRRRAGRSVAPVPGDIVELPAART